MVFTVPFGLLLTALGLVAAFFYLPPGWKLVLALGLVLLVGSLWLDARLQHRRELRRLSGRRA